MPDYISAPIETEPDVLAEDSFDFLEGAIPGWEPRDTQLDTWLITSLARQAAELRDVASDVPTTIFRYFGAAIMNIQPLDATSASVNATITAKDNAGYTIPAGYAVGIRDSSGVLWGFVTTADVVIPNGSTATAAGAVTLIATEEGAGPSGLGAPGQQMELITALSSVSSVTMTAATGGGQDAEEDDVYLNRLARNLALQAPRPITPNDFATYALNVPGVGRALALDGYNPNTNTWNNERTITLVIVDANGLAVSGAIKTAVQNLIAAAREVNFVIFVIDPTYTTIDVNYDAVVYPGWDPPSVETNIDSALAAYFNPATAGQPPNTEGPQWYDIGAIKLLDLAAVIGAVPGVKDINSITFRTAANPFATADIVIPVGSLTLPGAFVGTVA